MSAPSEPDAGLWRPYDVLVVRWADGGRTTLDIDASVMRGLGTRAALYRAIDEMVAAGDLQPLAVPGHYRSRLTTWQAAAAWGPR